MIIPHVGLVVVHLPHEIQVFVFRFGQAGIKKLFYILGIFFVADVAYFEVQAIQLQSQV